MTPEEEIYMKIFVGMVETSGQNRLDYQIIKLLKFIYVLVQDIKFQFNDYTKNTHLKAGFTQYNLDPLLLYQIN